MYSLDYSAPNWKKENTRKVSMENITKFIILELIMWRFKVSVLNHTSKPSMNLNMHLLDSL